MINSILFDFLKNVALRGKSGKAVLSTSSIAKELDISQQSVSRYLILLEKEGYIMRNRIKGGEEIVFTEKSYDAFRNEFNTMQYVLDSSKEIRVEGTLFTGLGEGSYYISRNGYVEKILKHLNFVPFPGTLNLRLTDEYLSFSAIINNISGFEIEPFEEDGRKFGGIRILKAYLEGEFVGVVLPERTHYEKVLEIISPENLRKKFALSDGDRLKISLNKNQ